VLCLAKLDARSFFDAKTSKRRISFSGLQTRSDAGGSSHTGGETRANVHNVLKEMNFSACHIESVAV